MVRAVQHGLLGALVSAIVTAGLLMVRAGGVDGLNAAWETCAAGAGIGAVAAAVAALIFRGRLPAPVTTTASPDVPHPDKTFVPAPRRQAFALRARLSQQLRWQKVSAG